MTHLAEAFRAFFEGVWLTQPFDWQVGLAERVVETGAWPDVIDLPTGAGKTSALDIAAFALAQRPDVMPRRIAFVVDRRTIVDQTADRAVRLSEALRKALKDGSNGPVGDVARALAGLGGSGEPLDVGRLRGGARQAVEPGEWLRWPDQPAVIVSTVDAFGSRLLFRGYGVRRGMRPVHAGLTGLDTLVLLDEVHLSTALVDTLHAVRELAPAHIGRPNLVVQMSATPVGAVGTRFPSDRSLVTSDPSLSPRVAARKSCRLLPRIGKGKQPAEEAWVAALPDLVEATDVHDGVVGIVVNRVATAVAVHAALRRANQASVLVTGRMRAHERRQAEVTATVWSAPDRAAEQGRRFIVATQAIEVGADYSFDALITEVCPLASLRQRLGRLDRRGQLAAAGTPATALIVATAAQPLDDPIYGLALGDTLASLEETFGFALFDGGPLSRDWDALTGDETRQLDVTPVNAAVLMPAHLELLAATNPEPPSGPDVDAFLHGFRDPNADVSLVWRNDLGPGQGVTDSADLPTPEVVQLILNALPAFADERIDVPLTAARRWLAGRSASDVADIDARGEPPEDGPFDRPAWIIDEAGLARLVRSHGRASNDLSPADLKPGVTLYVPSESGGLRDGAWDPTSTDPVTDLGDLSGIAGDWVAYRPLSISGPRPFSRDDDAAWEKALVAAANAAANAAALPATLRDVLVYGHRWAVIRPRGQVTDGRDDANSFVGVSITLREHVTGVAKMASAIAARCGLPPEVVEDVHLAGLLHDLGKADERFQLSLAADEIALAMVAEPMAKSSQPRRQHRRVADATWAYPRGARHEFLSVALAESAPGVLSAAHDADLVLHLVETHHGNARPWLQVVPDPHPREATAFHGATRLVAVSTIAADAGATAVERTVRLTERYGVYGLAWLETIFRLGDHRRSEAETSTRGAS